MNEVLNLMLDFCIQWISIAKLMQWIQLNLSNTLFLRLKKSETNLEGRPIKSEWKLQVLAHLCPGVGVALCLRPHLLRPGSGGLPLGFNLVVLEFSVCHIYTPQQKTTNYYSLQDLPSEPELQKVRFQIVPLENPDVYVFTMAGQWSVTIWKLKRKNMKDQAALARSSMGSTEGSLYSYSPVLISPETVNASPLDGEDAS